MLLSRVKVSILMDHRTNANITTLLTNKLLETYIYYLRSSLNRYIKLMTATSLRIYWWRLLQVKLSLYHSSKGFVQCVSLWFQLITRIHVIHLARKAIPYGWLFVANNSCGFWQTLGSRVLKFEAIHMVGLTKLFIIFSESYVSEAMAILRLNKCCKA